MDKKSLLNEKNREICHIWNPMFIPQTHKTFSLTLTALVLLERERERDQQTELYKLLNYKKQLLIQTWWGTSYPSVIDLDFYFRMISK